MSVKASLALFIFFSADTLFTTGSHTIAPILDLLFYTPYIAPPSLPTMGGRSKNFYRGYAEADLGVHW